VIHHIKTWLLESLEMIPLQVVGPVPMLSYGDVDIDSAH
jgi:hypothetical protein